MLKPPRTAAKAMPWTQGTLLLAWLLPVAVLAGCVGDSGENAKLNYDGSGLGSHNDSSDCDSDGTLTVSGTIEDGQVEVVVTDGNGEEIYSEELEDELDVDGEALDGAEGDWSLTATRLPDALLGGFNGSYSILMTC